MWQKDAYIWRDRNDESTFLIAVKLNPLTQQPPRDRYCVWFSICSDGISELFGKEKLDEISGDYRDGIPIPIELTIKIKEK